MTPTGHAPTPATRPRFDRLDALRAVAIVWMAVFHFCFDLNHFGFTRQNFYTDPFWTLQRSAIVSLFLFCAGMGQAIALDQRQPWPRFWRRWAQVARSGGAHVWMQINHPGRQMQAALGQTTLAPSAVPLALGALSKQFPVPKEMTQADIADVQRDHSDRREPPQKIEQQLAVMIGPGARGRGKGRHRRTARCAAKGNRLPRNAAQG